VTGTAKNVGAGCLPEKTPLLSAPHGESKAPERIMSHSRQATDKVLVVAPSWIGDAVLSQPLLRRLAERRPLAPIDVLAPPWVLPVYRRMREVADTVENPFGHGELSLVRRRRFGHELGKRHYSHAYVLPNSLKSALVPWFAGIPERTGYTGEMRYGLLTDRRTLDTRELPLMVERFAWLAQSSNGALRRPLPNPRMHVGRNEWEATCARLALAAPQRLACFCPGAEYGPAKRWLPIHFAELAKQLKQRGYTIWLLGSIADEPVGDEIVKASDASAINLCGRTTLDDAIVVLSAAQLVVTNDSGLMHVAAALDRPTIAIYGSSSPGFTPPLSDKASVVKLDIPCSPCFARTCALKHFDCMTKLAPATVLKHIDALESHP
jgi:heptosyltransferase-2